MIRRILEKKLSEMAKKFPVLAIFGPRQSGKTTLAKKTFPKHAYVSLEDYNNREFAEEDPKYFLETYAKENGAIFDEIQHAPRLLSYIQTYVDEKEQTGQFVLTGSQNFLLNERISQSLAGRVFITILLPLSIEEIQPHENNFRTYLFKGSYPRIYANDISPTDFYPSYTFTFVERDVRQLKQIENLKLFQTFIKMCAGRVGQLINFSDMSRDLGISHVTVKEWLSLLEASFLLFLLKPYSTNHDKRLIKTPKLYFYDLGLACSLLNITDEKQLENHPLVGNLFESFVISELYKYHFHHAIPFSPYFWRDKEKHEIDVLLDRGSILTPIEIKSTTTITEKLFSQLNYWQSLTHAIPASESILIQGGTEKQMRRFGKVFSWQDIPTLFNELYGL